MARKSKKKALDLNEPIVGEVTDLRSDYEMQIEKELEKPAVAPEEPQEPQEPQEPTPPALTKDELHRLQLTQFQARAFDAEAKLEMIKRDLFVKQVDPEGKLQQMMSIIRGRTDEAVAAKQDYAKTVKDIEERLKLNLKEWAYDENNGVLSRVDQ